VDNEANEYRDQFARNGYYVCENILDQDMVDRLNHLSDEVLAQQDPGHFAQHRTTGSMVMVDYAMAYQHPVMAELIGHPKTLAALAQLGFAEPKFGHGRIISKPPHSPPLFWHEDGRFWDDPVSYTAQPIQVFLMYYLIDTNRHNGCLRIIPGSHLKRHRLHDLPPAHTDEIQQADEGHPALQIDPDEVDVPVQAGDLVIGDARLLHAAHPNRSEQRRTVITLWFCPNYDQLPESIQAIYGKPRHKPDHWSDEIWNLVEPLVATYQGNAEAAEYNRIPDQRLA